MRKASREMPADWALEVLDKAPYITVSMCEADGTPYAVPLSLVRTDENTFYFHCAMEGKKLDIIGTMQKLVAMKHQRFLQMAITIPLIIAWLGWVGYEMYQNLPMAGNDFMSGMFQGGLFGGAIGAVFGLAIAFRIYFKMQKTNDDIIKDIEELQRED